MLRVTEPAENHRRPAEPAEEVRSRKQAGEAGAVVWKRYEWLRVEWVRVEWKRVQWSPKPRRILWFRRGEHGAAHS